MRIVRALALVVLVGCGIDAVGTLAAGGSDASGDGGAPDGWAPPPGGEGGAADGGLDALVGDADADSAPSPLIYVTTASKLFTFSPITKQWAFVTDFATTCPEVDEAAVNGTGDLYASSSTRRALYKFDPATFACAKVADAGSIWSYAFSFVPKQTFDSGTDTLAGFTSRDYIRMGLDGTASVVGSNALDVLTVPSGDMVSMGDRAFLSVYDSGDCYFSDCLLEIDPKTGAVVKNWGNFPGDKVYALGHWGGKIYGFRGNGDVYEVTLATPLSIVTYPGPDGGASITGAGASTAAPTQ